MEGRALGAQPLLPTRASRAAWEGASLPGKLGTLGDWQPGDLGDAPYPLTPSPLADLLPCLSVPFALRGKGLRVETQILPPATRRGSQALCNNPPPPTTHPRLA